MLTGARFMMDAVASQLKNAKWWTHTHTHTCFVTVSCKYADKWFGMTQLYGIPIKFLGILKKNENNNYIH